MNAFHPFGEESHSGPQSKRQGVARLSEAQKVFWAAAIFLSIYQLFLKGFWRSRDLPPNPFQHKLFHQQKLTGYGEVGFRTGKKKLDIQNTSEKVTFDKEE